MCRAVALWWCAVIAAPGVLAQASADSTVAEADYGMVRTNLQMTYDRAGGSLRDGFSARVSYQCFRNGTFTVTANGRYSSVTARFRPGELPEGADPEALGMNGVHLTWQTGVSVTARVSLFGRPLLAFGHVSADWGQGGYERTMAMLTAMLLLRHTERTQFGLGPMALVNTTSRVPVFLVFMYRHRFNSRWLVNLYGGMFGVDYTPTRSDLIAVGGDIDVKTFYFSPRAEGLSDRCQYRRTAFRPMVKYRRRLKPHLYLEAAGGVVLSMSSRVNGLTGTTEYLSVRQRAVPFFQAGVSYAL